jgi:predicted ATPase
LLLGTVRIEEAANQREYQALRERLGRGPGLTEIFLDPLDETQTRQLVQTLLRVEYAPFLGQRVHHYAGGNPLFVQETLRLLVDKGFLPPGWRDSIATATANLPVPEVAADVLHARLGALKKTGHAHRLLEAAAVIGRPFDIQLVQAVSGLTTAATYKAIDELVARRILRREEELFGFTQELLQSAAYEMLRATSPLRCMLLHQAVAAQLEARAGAAPTGLMLQELARHFYEGELWPKAVKSTDILTAHHAAIGTGSCQISRALALPAVRALISTGGSQ